MYKLIPPIFPYTESNFVLRIADNASIPFVPANTDYQQFKKHLAEGGELQAADGTVMTPEQVQEFLLT